MKITQCVAARLLFLRQQTLQASKEASALDLAVRLHLVNMEDVLDVKGPDWDQDKQLLPKSLWSAGHMTLHELKLQGWVSKAQL